MAGRYRKVGGNTGNTLIKERRSEQFQLVRDIFRDRAQLAALNILAYPRYHRLERNVVVSIMRFRICREFALAVCLLATCLLDQAQSRNEYARLFDKCAAERNAFDCLKRRALEILDSAIKDDTVYMLNEYVSIGRDPSAAARNIDRSFKENGTELSLDQMLDNKFHEYISSRNVKLTIPGDAFQGKDIDLVLLFFSLYIK